MTDDIVTDAPPVPATTPALDIEVYRGELAGLNLTPEQENGFLTTLWSILATFVHLGVDVGLADPCGQLTATFETAAADRTEGVDSDGATAPETPNQQDER